MPFKWKCVNSSNLVLETEKNDNEETDIIGMEGQSLSSFQKDTPIVQEQQHYGVTKLTECDTKNGIMVGVVCGYTVSNETYNTMPSTHMLPVDAEQTVQYIKENPLEHTWDNGITSDYVGVKYEELNKDTGDNTVEEHTGTSVLQQWKDTSYDHEQKYDSEVDKGIKCGKNFDSSSDLKKTPDGLSY